MTEAAFETVLYRVDEGVARLTLNRPDKMNAMNSTMRVEIAAAARRAADEARAMLIDGAASSDSEQKRAFCAGQDLGDVRKTDLERVLIEEYGPMLRSVAEAPIPSVVAVAGAAAGAGLHLALAADIVFAGRSARFVSPFARIGLMPAGGGSYFLPRRIGATRARGFTLLGEPIDAETAEDWGMIWRAVDDEVLEETALAAARRLASGPTEAFRLGGEALRVSLDNDLDAQLRLEAKLQGRAGRTRDYLEGVSAFLEKRRPDFEGR